MTKKSKKKKSLWADNVRQVQASQWTSSVEVGEQEFVVNSPVKHTILNKKDSQGLSITIAMSSEGQELTWPHSLVRTPKKNLPKKRR